MCFPKLDVAGSSRVSDGAITEDYDRISRARFLCASIGAEYEKQCRLLCYGPHPSRAEVQARFAELRCLP